MNRILAVPVLFVLLAAPVRANFYPIHTVQDFVDHCDVDIKVDDNIFDNLQTGICIGFVGGLVEAAEFNCLQQRAYSSAVGLGAEIPDDNFRNHTAIMMDWAVAVEDAGRLRASNLLIPLSETWPCE